MNISKFAASAVAMAASLPDLTSSKKISRGKGKSSRQTDAQYKRSKIAGMMSKQYQFPDREKLPDGRHRFFLQNGVLVQRKV